ncbi:MAG: response regulator [bacterium]|nr:response regulator [bacterium]
MSGEKILIVEDSPTIKEMVIAIIKAEGFAFEWTDSITTAIEILETGTVDLVLSDIILTETFKTGYDLLKYVKDSKVHSSIPVILMSDKRDKERARKVALFRGASEFVSKPFQPEALVEVIYRILASKKNPENQ